MFRYQIEHHEPIEPPVVRTYTAWRDEPMPAYRDLIDAAGPCQLRAYCNGALPPYSVDIEGVGIAWLESDDEDGEE